MTPTNTLPEITDFTFKGKDLPEGLRAWVRQTPEYQKGLEAYRQLRAAQIRLQQLEAERQQLSSPSDPLSWVRLIGDTLTGFAMTPKTAARLRTLQAELDTQQALLVGIHTALRTCQWIAEHTSDNNAYIVDLRATCEADYQDWKDRTLRKIRRIDEAIEKIYDRHNTTAKKVFDDAFAKLTPEELGAYNRFLELDKLFLAATEEVSELDSVVKRFAYTRLGELLDVPLLP
jgi:hypothetical protein